MQTNIHFLSHLAHFFLEWEMFQTIVVEKIRTHILCSVTFFLLSKIVPFVIECGKILQSGSGNVIIWRMRIVCCIPQAKNILRLCNTNTFSTATMVARTLLIVTLYVHCLSCLYSCYVPNVVGNAAVIFGSIDGTKIALLLLTFF